MREGNATATARKSAAAWLDPLHRATGTPTTTDRADFYSRWDSAQTNDQEIVDSDPLGDEVTAAIELSERDPRAGFQVLFSLAERGSVWSMSHVAWRYSNGLGVERDEAQAEVWWRRAMEGGSLRALLACGRASWDRGDWDACEAVYGVGAAMGWAPAQYFLATTRYRQVRSRATLRQVLPLLESAAAKGSPGAQDFLATCLVSGVGGLGEIPRGFRLFLAVGRRELADFETQKEGSGAPT